MLHSVPLVNVVWLSPLVRTSRRCLLISEFNVLLAILVGEAQNWLPELVERAQKLKVSGGFEPGADL